MLTRDIITAEIKNYYKQMFTAKNMIDLYYYLFAASAIIKLGYDLGILLYDEARKTIDIIYDKYDIIKENFKE